MGRLNSKAPGSQHQALSFFYGIAETPALASDLSFSEFKQGGVLANASKPIALILFLDVQNIKNAQNFRFWVRLWAFSSSSINALGPLTYFPLARR